jgi:hypothetical protein
MTSPVRDHLLTLEIEFVEFKDIYACYFKTREIIKYNNKKMKIFYAFFPSPAHFYRIHHLESMENRYNEHCRYWYVHTQYGNLVILGVPMCHDPNSYRDRRTD